jgi:DNA-binding NtrC family response regulator
VDIKQTKIVVIHDGLMQGNDPLLVELQMKFGKDQIVHFEKSNEGLDYVLENLNQKMIVLLDINFSNGEKNGITVFEEIRQKTALVYVILVTANQLSSIKNEDLVLLINHDAFAIENVDSGSQKIISLIDKAVHKLNVQVASVMEQWICEQPEDNQNKPYLLRDGRAYTFADILSEVRNETEIGKEMEMNILLLAIDLFAKNNENDD